MVLVASGTLAWACGGDDDDESSDAGVTSDGGSGGSGGTAPTTNGGSGGTGGSSGGTAGSGGSGGGGGTTASTTGAGSGGTNSTTGTGTGGSGGSGGSAGDAGAAGMAGAAGDTGAPTLEELCQADCAKLEQVGCESFDASTCVQDLCMYFYNPNCDAEYRAYLECDAAADVSEFYCINGVPSFASSCYEQFLATICDG